MAPPTAPLLTWALAQLLLACAAQAASCDCTRIPRTSRPTGGGVCGQDGLKYATPCLAICQGVEVDHHSSSCAPVVMQLAQGTGDSEWVDWEIISAFSERGYNYLGEESEGDLDERPAGGPHDRGVGRDADLLFAGEGSVYGRPFRGVMSEDELHALSRRLNIMNIQVFGDNQMDDRSPVTDTTQDPWNKIGLVEPVFCSGFLVGPRHVLTSAHCLLNNRSGRKTRNIVFSPGVSSVSQPFGSFQAEYTVVPACFEFDDVWGCDVGMIVLTERAGDTVGFFTINQLCQSSTQIISTAGYPGDKPRKTMWFERCEPAQIFCEAGDGPTVLRHTCDVVGGMSGAPIWDESRNIIAVHTGFFGALGNIAAFISPQTYMVIMNWLNS